MKKFVTLTLFFLICFAVSVSASEGDYVVKLREGNAPVSLLNLLTEVNADHRLYTADDYEGVSSYPDYIEYIEENHTLDIIDTAVLEDIAEGISLFSAEDPFYSRMWQLQSVNAPFAWDVCTYGNEINIGVIDSGCYPHSDFGSALKGGCNVMPGEDREDYNDKNGHGTVVAGIIAAQHNSMGIRGIAPRANLYAIKITDLGTDISLSLVADAIYAAVDEFDCKIINMSLGGSKNSESLYEAVKYAYDKGVFIICAAGNEGEKTEGTRILYPGGYPETISVGAVTDENKRAPFSQRNDTVFVSAPGYQYISLYPDNKYASGSGTSQACPIVTSAAAIMLSADPDMTFEEFKDYIEDWAVPLEDAYTGCGLINIEAMLRAYIDLVDIYVSPRSEDTVYVNNNTSESVNLVYRVPDSAEFHTARIASGTGRTADFVKGEGRLYFWTDYLRPFRQPKDYGTFQS